MRQLILSAVFLLSFGSAHAADEDYTFYTTYSNWSTGCDASAGTYVTDYWWVDGFSETVPEIHVTPEGTLHMPIELSGTDLDAYTAGESPNETFHACGESIVFEPDPSSTVYLTGMWLEDITANGVAGTVHFQVETTVGSSYYGSRTVTSGILPGSSLPTRGGFSINDQDSLTTNGGTIESVTLTYIKLGGTAGTLCVLLNDSMVFAGEQ